MAFIFQQYANSANNHNQQHNQDFNPQQHPLILKKYPNNLTLSFNQSHPSPNTQSSLRIGHEVDRMQVNRVQSSPKINVNELSRDLVRLKEQLQKITDKNIEINKNHIINETHAPLYKQNYSQQPFSPIKANEFPLFRQNGDSRNTQRVDMVTLQQEMKLKDDKIRKSKQIVEPPSKKNKINNFMHTKESKEKPFNTHQQRTFWSPTIPLQPQSKQHKLEVQQLKEKMIKMSSQLQCVYLQKQLLGKQLKIQRQQKQGLKMQVQKLSKAKDRQRMESSPQNSDKKIIKVLQDELNKLRNNQNHNFDQFLMSQLQENKLLRSQMEEKTEDVQEMKVRLQIQGKVNEQLRQKNKIMELKANAEVRAAQKRMQIQLSDKSNELQTCRHAIQTLGLKYETAITEIKEKDDFISTYILSRSKQQQKSAHKAILQRYIITFPFNKTMKTLLEEQHEISLLRKEVERLRGLQS